MATETENTNFDYISLMRNDIKTLLKKTKNDNSNFELKNKNLNIQETLIKMMVYVNTIFVQDKESKLNSDKEIEKYKNEVQNQKDKIAILNQQATYFYNQLRSKQGKIDELSSKIQLLEEKLEKKEEAFNFKQDYFKKDEEIIQVIENIEEQIKNIKNINILNNGSHPILKIKPPIFEGKPSEKPLRFLSELKDYVSLYNTSSKDNLKILINQCLKKGAKDWFYLFKDKINSFQEFEKLFKKH